MCPQPLKRGRNPHEGKRLKHTTYYYSKKYDLFLIVCVSVIITNKIDTKAIITSICNFWLSIKHFVVVISYDILLLYILLF